MSGTRVSAPAPPWPRRRPRWSARWWPPPACWSTTPALAGQARRYALGAAVLAVVVRANGPRRLPRLSARELGLVAALAASGLAGFNLCVLAAVDRADPAVVGLVIGCTPVVLALVGRPLGLCARRGHPAGGGRGRARRVGRAGPADRCPGPGSGLARPGRHDRRVRRLVLGVARLGVERAGLFAGLIPVAALASVAVVGPARSAGPSLPGRWWSGPGSCSGSAAPAPAPAAAR